MGIELLEAGHCRGDVVGRGKLVFVVIAGAAPFDKGVGGGPLDRCRDGVAAIQHDSVACLDD
jgi:hypothetical protein